MKGQQQWHEESLKIEEGIRHLHLLAADARLFTDHHPKLGATLDAALETWEGILATLQEVELKQVGPDLIYKNQSLQGHLHTTKEFIQTLKRRQIECLVFKPGLTRRELVEYAHYLRLSDAHRKQLGEPGQHFRSRGVTHIEIFKLGDLRRGGQHHKGAVRGLPVALKDLRCFRQDSLHIIENLHKKAEVARVIDLDGANTIVDGVLKAAVNNSSVMLGLNTIKSTDPYTQTHTLNVVTLAACFARYLGIQGEALHKLSLACLFHDIGKVFVPIEILNKPGRLTPEEWKIMQNHTVYGARFLLSIPNLPPLAPLVAYEHHMNLEGTGYPRPGRPYNRINMASFIVFIADFYDALSTNRPYRRAMPPRKVVEMMQKMDDQKMEPRLRKLFLRMIGEYPIGSVVRLDTGELAVVSKQDQEEPMRPEVHLVREPGDRRLEPSVLVSLTETRNGKGYVRSIVEALDPLQVDVDPLAVLQEAAHRPLSAGPPQQQEQEEAPAEATAHGTTKPAASSSRHP